MKTTRKLIVYIAASLDGFIAKPNDDLSFLSQVEKPGEDYGYNAFIKTVDTVIIGRKTFDWVVKQVNDLPHKDKQVFVITHTPKPSTGHIEFYTGNLKDLVSKLKSGPGLNIFCDGGGEIINLLLDENLIDEFIISIIPVLLGSGTRLFHHGYPEQLLDLVYHKSYDTGLVQLGYRKKPA